MTVDDGRVRCRWAGSDPLNCAYHDEEWGVPVHDSRALFELLVLEGAQAGLAWITILRKRDGYRRAYEGFDPERMAAWSDDDLARLLTDPGIVRNRAKLAAARGNAQAYLAIERDEGPFGQLLWELAGGEVRQNAWPEDAGLPAETPESARMSRELRRRGLRFVGPTICYAFMQSAGMVNDHATTCFRHRELGGPGV